MWTEEWVSKQKADNLAEEKWVRPDTESEWEEARAGDRNAELRTTRAVEILPANGSPRPSECTSVEHITAVQSPGELRKVEEMENKEKQGGGGFFLFIGPHPELPAVWIWWVLLLTPRHSREIACGGEWCVQGPFAKHEVSWAQEPGALTL